MNRKRGISTSFLTNPLYAYAFGFLVVLFVFSLKWSNLYTEISGGLLIFILLSSLFSIMAGYSIKGHNLFRQIPESRANHKFFIFIIAGNVLEYIYCRSIPLVSVLFGGGNYKDFEGIPMFHVLLIGVSLFWGIYVFHQYQSNTESKKLLRYVLLSYLPYIIGLNRGLIVYALLSSIMICFLRKKRISLRIIIAFILGGILFLMGFGFVGNIRGEESLADNTYILRVGGATDRFIESNIPKSLYWGYLYIASPIGNLEEAIQYADPDPNISNFVDMLITQTTPDFLGKRISFLGSGKSVDTEKYLVTTIFNAPTTYSIPYILMGWSGIIYMFFFMIFIVYLYTIFISVDSIYFLSGWSYLTATILLNNFNNMWYFNGLYIISIPLIISFIKKIKIKRANDKY